MIFYYIRQRDGPKIMAVHSNQILMQTGNHHPLDLTLWLKVMWHGQTLCHLTFQSFSQTSLALRACLMGQVLEILAIPPRVSMGPLNFKGHLVTSRCQLLDIHMIHIVKEQGISRTSIIQIHLALGTSPVCILLVPLLQDISQTSIIVSQAKVILVLTQVRLGILLLQVRVIKAISLLLALVSMVGPLPLGKVQPPISNSIHMVKVRVWYRHSLLQCTRQSLM